jgi:hypothetical protein
VSTSAQKPTAQAVAPRDLITTQWWRRGTTMKGLALAAVIFGIGVCFASDALGQHFGTISDGSCSCKTRCDGGKSRFSPGHTVEQCRRMCVKAYLAVRLEKSGQANGAMLRRCRNDALLVH